MQSKLVASLLSACAATLLLARPAEALKPSEVYKKAGPAVVLVLGSDGRIGQGGTGSIISHDGKVITNAHVVLNDKGQPFRRVDVFLKPPKVSGDSRRDLVNRYHARVVSYSPVGEMDLALLQILDAPPNLPTISFADPDAVGIGDEAIAIGHPEQGGLWTLTTGVVSTVIANLGGIEGKDVFQTEASVNKGNSGGPLLDDKGHMIGINTEVARRGRGGSVITDVNFAIKSSVAVSWLAGQGMGLAYAKPAAKAQDTEVVLAVAPEPVFVAPAQAAEPPKAQTAPPATKVEMRVHEEPQVVEEPPSATIVLYQAPPKAAVQVAKVVKDGQSLGAKKKAEKIAAGKPLDSKNAKPKYHTQKRPFSMEDLRKKQMKEMEKMMDEMRGKVKRKSGRGMGLW